MSSGKSSITIPFGLAVLIALLIAAAFLLNLRHCRTATDGAELAALKSLDQRRAHLLRKMEDKEERGFALIDTPKAFEANLFKIDQQHFLPAHLAGITNHDVPEETASLAFQKGVSLLPSTNAVPYFVTASRALADENADMYQKISAMLNLIEFEQDPRLAAQVLIFLELPTARLSEAQINFFRSMLQDSFPNLNEIESRQHELLELGEQLRKTVNIRKGAFRTRVDDLILSVRDDEYGLLYAPDFDLGETTAAPSGLSRELFQGAHITAPQEALDQEKLQITQQFHMANLILFSCALPAALLLCALAATLNRLRKLDAVRTEFIATVSHELRTPLSLIRLHAETLKHGRLPKDKIAGYHQIILTEAERLTGMVNNVLDFSRMERDQLQIHPEPTDLSNLVHQTADSFEDRLAHEGMVLERGIEDGIEAVVDPLAYSQIVFNLLDNAVKYSGGSKTVRIGLDVSDGGNTLSVADQGIGIPDKLKPRIFDDFVRSNDRNVSARRGSGIGLSVARKLTQMMNGTIQVADNEPDGSVFTVRIKS